jgi:hypothetical protein
MALAGDFEGSPGQSGQLEVTSGVIMMLLSPGVSVIGLVVMLGGYVSLGAILAFIVGPLIFVIGLILTALALGHPDSRHAAARAMRPCAQVETGVILAT